MHIRYKQIVSLLFVTFSLLFSVSAPPFPFDIEQPDGSKIPVRTFGHEYYNWMETLDGYVIKYVEDDIRKGWYYSELNENGQFTASNIFVTYPSPVDINIPKGLREISPKVRKFRHEQYGDRFLGERSLGRQAQGGTLKPLIFLVDFNDKEHTYTAEHFEKLFFSNDLSPAHFPNTPNHTNYNMSVREYYQEISNGEFDFSGSISSIVNWHSVDYSHNDYTDYDHGFGQGTNGISLSAGALVVEIAMDNKDNIDFGQFDGDGDGAVDVIILVIEGKGGSITDPKYFWPHMSNIPTGDLLNQIDSDAASPDGYFLIDDVLIKKYIVVYEQSHYSSVGAYYGCIHPIGTICHELGHVLGLPDLYDTSVKAEGIGTWGLMGSGNWQNQTSPAYMSAWSRYRLGFIEPIVLENKMDYTLTLKATELFEDSVAFILPMDSNMPHEYILLENRQRFGSDSYLPGEGMLVWHIDENITDMYPAIDSVNVYPEFYGVNLLQADGENELNLGQANSDDGDPFPGTSLNSNITHLTVPNTNLYSYDRNGDGTVDVGGESGITIRSIQENNNIVTCIIDVPNTNGTIISYDEGNFMGSGYPDQAALHWAGIRFVATESKMLSGVKTFIMPSSSPYYVNEYIIKIWEGWSNNKPNIQLGRNIVGTINWSANGNRNGGWVDISLISENISLQSGTEYYIEINFDGGLYTYDKALYSSSVADNKSYYRSSEQGNCYRLSDGDWNLRAIIGGCGTNQDQEVWPGNTDADSTVNAADIVPIGLYWGMTGCNRLGNAYLWESNSQPTGWDNPCAAHADANGDGIVDISDVLVMLVNWGKKTADSVDDPYIVDSSCSATQDLASHRENFYQIYQSLDGNSEVETSIRSHLDKLFNFSMLPTDFQLSPNFPNPFNASTRISFTIPSSEIVKIAIYDILGRKLHTLIDSQLNAGYYTINWDANDYASGIYIIHMETAGFTMAQKAVLLK